jgi:hypothetical protein
MRFLLPALLPLFLVMPAAAQTDDLTTIDHLAAVLIGFEGDGTAMVAGGLTANVTREGPGKFAGTVEEVGSPLTFEIVETSPCVFEATYEGEMGLFRLGVDVTKIRSFSFEQGDDQTGYTFFGLILDAPQGTVESIAPDGTRSDAGTRNNIGTSMTLDELNAAAAALQAACPPAV